MRGSFHGHGEASMISMRFYIFFLFLETMKQKVWNSVNIKKRVRMRWNDDPLWISVAKWTLNSTEYFKINFVN